MYAIGRRLSLRVSGGESEVLEKRELFIIGVCEIRARANGGECGYIKVVFYYYIFLSLSCDFKKHARAHIITFLSSFPHSSSSSFPPPPLSFSSNSPAGRER